MSSVTEVSSCHLPPPCGCGWVGKGTRWVPHQLLEPHVSLAKASHVAIPHFTEASNLHWSQKERWTRRFVKNPEDDCSTLEVLVNDCSHVCLFYLAVGTRTLKTHPFLLPRAWKKPEQRDSYAKEYISRSTIWIPIVIFVSQIRRE